MEHLKAKGAIPMGPIYLTTLILVAFALATHGLFAETGQSVETSQAADEFEVSTKAAIQTIDRAIEREESTADVGAQVQLSRDAAAKVITLAQQNQSVESILTQALSESQQQAPDKANSILQKALREAREILTFRPVIEAPTPQGFPKWTPVGEIRVQRYPKYRAARTKMSSGEVSAFWTLFNHIESNTIKMTAPVEMSYEQSASNEPCETSMAFLYANTEVGQTGSAGSVTVADVSPATFVSIGVHGETTPEAVTKASSLLKAWLKNNADRYEASGDLRVLGYNSPMIPRNKRYFEVQIPVRELPSGE
jgi:hypothetical protein